MLKNILGILVLVFSFAACKSVKKVQKIETEIFKKDTAQTVVIAEAPKVDSAAIVKDIMGKLVRRRVDYKTFNAKINVDYEGAENSQKMTAYVSLKKDSALFVKIAVSPYGVVMNLVTLDNTDFKVLHSKLDDVDDQRNRTCDITLSDYVNVNGYQFSTNRKISVSEKSKLDIGLEFKQFNFNEPMAYRFEIPKNYKTKKPTPKAATKGKK
jgi:hypothetical protein